MDTTPCRGITPGLPTNNGSFKATERTEAGVSLAQPMSENRPMDAFVAKVGERYERDGKVYEVARITPAGAAGRRISDGPVVHVKPVRDDGTLADFTADVWIGSISDPAAAYRTFPRAASPVNPGERVFFSLFGGDYDGTVERIWSESDDLGGVTWARVRLAEPRVIGGVGPARDWVDVDVKIVSTSPGDDWGTIGEPAGYLVDRGYEFGRREE